MPSDLLLETVYHHAFRKAVDPYPFQRAIATRADADVLIAPTGLGKTAAVTLGWAWRRLTVPAHAPRRLVWCLPMRTLVEQTEHEAEQWMNRLACRFNKAQQPVPSVHVLMGGAVDDDWRLRPELPAVIIGTQDMLLSRALMRGYGMSRFGWSVDYGLLHTDALWVYDEVQLMGAGLATSAQLEAFRRRDGWCHSRPARSLWISATLDPDWLRTAEFRAEIPNPVVLRWDDGKPPEPPALAARLDAVKRLRRAETVLRAEGVKKPETYARSLAHEVVAARKPGTTTLVIVNTVARAQALHAALAEAAPSTGGLLIHSRFRPPDRSKLEERLREGHAADRIVVATQAVEAGVDMTSATLFTELAPWSSLVQRFGRCNRAGERNALGGADVYWIDIEGEIEAATARPYEPDQLLAAREIVSGLEEVSPRSLPPPSPPPAPRQVIRPKDFEELFDTDADLSGYDLDISPYIRDSDDVSVQVFWRAVGDADGVILQEPPGRDELCSAPLGSDLSKWLEGKPAYVDDALAPGGAARKNGRRTPRTWVRLKSSVRLRPGLILLLDVSIGGYDSEVGFVGKAGIKPVEPVAPPPAAIKRAAGGADADPGATMEGDPLSEGYVTAVELAAHTADVVRLVDKLARAAGFSPTESTALTRAASWHDLGKAYEPFQILLGRAAHGPLLAKSAERKTDEEKRARALASQLAHEKGLRPYFRHELASALAFLKQHDGEPQADLVAYLIAAHHGKVRMGLRALSEERPSDPARRIARGIEDGDCLPEVRCGDETSAALTLDLGLMEMGEDEMGRPSWAARTHGLLAEQGPFRLAYLEALLRIADWRASADKQGEGPEDA